MDSEGLLRLNSVVKMKRSIISYLLALFKRFEKCTAASFFALLMFFVYLTGMNLFFPAMMVSIESCGCFGELVHFTSEESFVKSIVLWVMTCFNIAIALTQIGH